MKIRVLSRKSDLAIIQAYELGDYLKGKYPEIEITIFSRYKFIFLVGEFS